MQTYSMPWFVVAAVMVATLGHGAVAEEGEPADTSVVELFTSQGCSSCPPADALLGQLAKRKDLIVLTLPVDYWDYLGWKDTLASPENSARQRAYAKSRGDHAVYTPQMVVNGLKHVVGSNRTGIESVLMQTKGLLNGHHVTLRTSISEDTLVIEVGAAPKTAPGETGVVWLLPIKSSVKVTIERGENTGREITYTNVVRDLMAVGKWTGEPVTLKLPAYKLLRDDADGCAVLLQESMTGPILGAVLHHAK
jgi:hypothetical protein